MNAPIRHIAWKPNPGPQTWLIQCPVFEALFGGARGGGKTLGMIGEFAVHAGRHPKHAVGLMLRRERTQLKETIEEAATIYEPLGAKWRDKDSLYEFPGGARIHYGYADNDRDIEAYQGWSLTRVYVEELGNFPRWAPIAKLFATLRNPHGIPGRFRATANPGGPGHSHIKSRYIDPAPLGLEILCEQIKNPLSGGMIERKRTYIPSRVSDNPKVDQDDYIANLVLSGAGSPALVKAWLEGDWNAIEGAFFSEWSSAKHVMKPFDIPSHWTRFVAGDWGTAKPFCLLWMAVASEETRHEGRLIPRGAIVIYREWYGCVEGQANVGIRWPASDVAARAKQMSAGETLEFFVLDPATFANTGGQTIAEAFAVHWTPPLAADNTRVARAGAMSGWNNVRTRLVGDGDNPMMFVFDTCRHLIRTLPVLQHDKLRAEDLDSDSEDHAADALRYGLNARPWLGKAPAQDQPMRDITQARVNDLFFGRLTP